MPTKGIGPFWASFLKFISAAAIPTITALVLWGRGLEARVNGHDVVVSAIQTDRINLKETLDGMKKELADVNRQLREMQSAIAVLTVKHSNEK